MDDKDFKEEVAQFWTEGSDKYDTHPGHGMGGDDEKDAWIRFLKEIIPEGTKKILDVGCGTGFLTVLLAELGYTVKGVDLSAGMQAHAKRKVEEGGWQDRVTFSIGDAEKLDDPDAAYDLVINRHLLWTLPHPYEAVDEWLRVTKPGGNVIIIDGNWTITDKKKKDEEEGEERRSYSKDVLDDLPIFSGGRQALEFVRREGYDIEVVELVEVDELERHKYKDVESISRDGYKREAFIIKK